MNKHKKLPSQAIQFQYQQQQQLQPQWQIHSNRLTFLEQSMTKLQKKFLKIQKAVVMLSEAEVQIKDEVKEKLNQMIAVVSQGDGRQGCQCKFDQEKFNRWKREIAEEVRVVKALSDKLRDSHEVSLAQIKRQIQKVKDNAFATVRNQRKQFEELINTTMHTIQMNNTKFIEDKLAEISFTIQKLQRSISTECVSMKNPYINSTQAQNNDTAPEYPKPYPRSFLLGSNQKSLAKLCNSRSSRLFQHNQQPSSSSKRLTQEENIDSYEVRSQNSGSLKHLPPYPTPQPPSQNNSRVVYLRQKLKQFQAINKKYQKKQVEFQNLQRQQLVFDPQSSPSSSKQSQANSFQRQEMLMNRENSAQKSFANKSSSKSVMKSNLISAQSSAKRIDKLKSIKDYLEQTESQAEDSFLEPNYQ